MGTAVSRVSAAQARIATTFHGEHVFSEGRDPLDVMVDVGVSYRVVGGLRLGEAG